MKLASGNSTSTREGRMDQLRRDRASSQVMRAEFPTVRQLRIELKFEGSHPNTPTSQLHELYPPARAYFTYPCPYAGCDGHFDLGIPVRAALEKKLPLSDGTVECAGSRPRDYASKQTCHLQLHYEVQATYEEKSRGRLRD